MEELKEIRLKRLTLFLLESIIIQNNSAIDEGFAAQFNAFVDKYYCDNKEIFGLLYDTILLEIAMKNNWEILSLEQMMILIRRYKGFEGYASLVDEVGKEVDAKINKLALLFTEYRIELFRLYYANPNEFYPKGYPRILQ